MKMNCLRYGCLALMAVLVAGIPLAQAQPASSNKSLVLPAQADAAVRTDLDVRRNDNYGCEPTLIVGTSRGGGGIPFGGPDAMRSLIRFDLSSIVQGRVTSARLELTFAAFDNGLTTSVYQVDVHRIVDSGSRTPWVEGNGAEFLPTPPGCVGTDPSFGVAWAGAGDNPDPDAANNTTQPDFDPAVIATATVSQATALPGDVFQWDITPVVQGWLNGTFPNFGLVLRDITADGSFRGVRFGSREAKIFNVPGAVDGPRLVLTFAGHAAIMVCHIPPGNPQNAHTIVIDASAVPSHLAHGDALGACLR